MDYKIGEKGREVRTAIRFTVREIGRDHSKFSLLAADAVFYVGIKEAESLQFQNMHWRNRYGWDNPRAEVPV